MAERPILFSAPMVRAILEGRKTQTRRIVKPQPLGCREGIDQSAQCSAGTGSDAVLDLRNRPWNRRDHLWVRETCWIYGQWHADGTTKSGRCRWRFRPVGQRVRYDNPGYENCAYWGGGPGWSHRPSIHMPRWASRITLEITDVRVERLQDISGMDAKREGVSVPAHLPHDGADLDYARREYRQLWQSIHGPGSWDANPWVWVIEFKKLEQA